LAARPNRGGVSDLLVASSRSRTNSSSSQLFHVEQFANR
jgi:hypothetical protein